MKIGFIGLGNMADPMIGAIVRRGIVPAENVLGHARTIKTGERFASKYGMTICKDNKEVASLADVLFLAVKPTYLEDVILEIRDSVREEALIISIAAGKDLAFLKENFGKSSLRIIRAMPNTPAMVGEGCTALCGAENVTEEDMDLAIRLTGSFGKAFTISERMMDVVGAVSGSSPAFVFMFIEAMADAAVEGGMARSQAYEIAAQAVLGSAKLVLESGKHPGELKDMVCSPGGTTISGVRTLEEMGMRAAVMDAIKATIDKTKLL